METKARIYTAAAAACVALRERVVAGGALTASGEISLQEGDSQAECQRPENQLLTRRGISQATTCSWERCQGDKRERERVSERVIEPVEGEGRECAGRSGRARMGVHPSVAAQSAGRARNATGTFPRARAPSTVPLKRAHRKKSRKGDFPCMRRLPCCCLRLAQSPNPRPPLVAPSEARIPSRRSRFQTVIQTKMASVWPVIPPRD